MTFFNLSDEEKLKTFENAEAYTDFMIEKGAMKKVVTVDVDTDETTYSYKPTNLFSDEFYKFIIKTYQSDITYRMVQFFSPFEDQIFGKSLEVQKELALEAFNILFDRLSLKIITIPRIRLSENEIARHELIERMAKVKFGLDAMKDNFSDDSELLFDYLHGNKDVFNRSLLHTNEKLEKRIQRYVDLQILIELNDRYKFETNKYFGREAYIKEIHDKYKDITENVKLFNYIYVKIDSFKSKSYKKAETSSLYVALKRENVIDIKPKRIMTFVKAEFEISLSKLPNPDSDLNDVTEARIKKYREEITLLDLPK